jgi:nucleotide-binding universal stress UspA family protein
MTSDGKAECVVVGVDGSAESATAMAWAARYAKAMGATIRAVLAWHYPTTAGVPPVGITPPSVSAEVEQNRRELLDRAIAAAFGDSPEVPIDRRIVYGHAAQVLIDESKDADLLVVGNRGHGAFSGMLLGSVSTHCVTHAACPVTVVRASEEA